MESPDLFSSSLEEKIASRAPLAARMRPTSLDDIVGQEHLVGPNGPLRRLIESDVSCSIILWGPPGTGKTTLAELVASTTRRRFERLSAVSSGVKDIREVIDSAKRALTFDSQSTVVFVDEIHRFNTTQQDALLHAVEGGVVSLVGATTENPAFSVNPALRSRSSVFALKPVSESGVIQVLERAATIAKASVSAEAAALIARRCTGDVRQALTSLEMAIVIANGSDVTLEHASIALSTSVSRLGVDDHYDIASAFIKSMRASKVDVALHWLARLIEGGEDPRFIARRIIIFASEDIGMADSSALQVAIAAADALDRVGLPEAAHNLAHAVIYMSTAPKSRAVTDALSAALTDVQHGRTGRAPVSTQTPPTFLPLGFTPEGYYRTEQ